MLKTGVALLLVAHVEKVDGDCNEMRFVGRPLAARDCESQLLCLSCLAVTLEPRSSLPTPPPDPELTKRNIWGKVYKASVCMAVLKRNTYNQNTAYHLRQANGF